MKLVHLVAAAANGVIGRGGKLPWHLSEDLKRFKTLTMGRVIIMGRKTWDSIGRALPGRHTIVVTRSPNFLVPEGVYCASSIDGALDLIQSVGLPDEEVFLVGGGEIYRATMDRVARIYLTEVHASVDGDAFYPDRAPQRFRETSRERFANSPDFSFVTLEAVQPGL